MVGINMGQGHGDRAGLKKSKLAACLQTHAHELSVQQQTVLNAIAQKFSIGTEFRRRDIFGTGRSMTSSERNALYKLQVLGFVKSTNAEHKGEQGWYRRLK
jgi:hypothetical protein